MNDRENHRAVEQVVGEMAVEADRRARPKCRIADVVLQHGRILHTLLLALLAAALSTAPAAASPAPATIPPEQLEFFEKRIRPILAQECYECHGSRERAKGGLVLDHRAAWEAGGESGPALVPGDPAASLLLQSIRHEHEDFKMPKSGAKLDERVAADFEQWIAWGAPDPREGPPSEEQLAIETDWEAVRQRRQQWWSFQPLSRPGVPRPDGVPDGSGPGGEEAAAIDAFVLERLAAEGLETAPPAGPRELLRRLHFNLVGLPPSREDLARFLEVWEQDPAAATGAETERLLADPRFGERWARHWMDWIRYADSHGSEGDPEIPHAWRYRDYLARALNADTPYEQLVLEHFAGDLLAEPRVDPALGLNESVLGLGHLRMVFHGFTPTDALEERVRFTDDQIDAATKAFLGLTVSCARCHDHKFDAISQADYFALYGVFTASLPATVAADAPGLLETHREELAGMKDSLRRALAEHWAAAVPEDPAIWEAALDPEHPPEHPLHLLRRLHEVRDDPGHLGRRWWDSARRLEAAFAETEAARAGAGIRRRWQPADPDGFAEWDRYGEGLGGVLDGPAPAGEFILNLGDGDGGKGAGRVVERVLPAGVYSHRISTRHRAVFASAPFELEGDSDSEFELHLHLAGEGSSARFVVQHYPRRGTVFPIQELDESRWRWLQPRHFDYWQGDRIHLELATGPDVPVQVREMERSWFGIREAYLVEKGATVPAPPREESLAALFSRSAGAAPDSVPDSVPDSFPEATARYAAALRDLLAAWGAGDPAFGDAEALFLDGILTAGLLPNAPDKLPAPLREAVRAYRGLEAAIPLPTRAPGVLERAGRDEPLQVRGDHRQPADPVPRRFLEAIDPTPYAADGSGRLEFARDLLREDNPFAARVIVNRVWHHLFGTGLVATPDNFGRLGEEPSHSELLDHLASRFRGELEWSIKALIREIVLSETWRRASEAPPGSLERDPDNRLLARHSVRRLEAEAIRDAFLAASGELSPEAGGPPAGHESLRRSLYLRLKRNDLPPLLTTFDFPVPAFATGRRDATNVPAQSLTLLNDPFIIARARAFGEAAIARHPAPDDEEGRLRHLFETALARPPSPEEADRARAFLYAAAEQHRHTEAEIERLLAERDSLRGGLAALLDPVRERLRENRRKALAGAEADGGGGAEAAVSSTATGEWESGALVAAWRFSEGAQDRVGGLSLELHGSARIEDDALVVDGTGFAASSPLPVDLGEKTFEALVQLDGLEQRGGGVLTVQDLRGGVFDSLVFGEREPRRWMAGSNHGVRSENLDCPDEEEAADRPVHLMLVYEADGTIRCYRDGEPWGRAVRQADLQPFAAGQSQVLLGLRHGTGVSGNRALSGRIYEARLHSRALGPEEAAAAARRDPLYVGEAELLATLDPAALEERGRIESRIAAVEEELATLREHRREAPLENRPWHDLAHAIFNLKEFLYLR